MLSAPTMTAQRQERKGNRLIRTGFCPGIAFIGSCAGRLLAGPLLASLLLAASVVLASLVGLGARGVPGSVAEAATTERVIVNRYTGLAIEGFDPVAYFVDARPRIGLPDFEASQAGVVWRFRSEGNRASFVAHPDIYGPQFGGYDPIDLARGVTFAQPPVLADLGTAALSVRPRGQPRRIRRRSGALPAAGEAALAGSGAGPGAVGQNSSRPGLSRASTSCFLGATRTWMAGTSPALTKSESSSRIRIAPGDEFRHDKALAATPELHVIAFCIGYLAAGRGDERVSGRDVPFAGRGEAGVKVGCPPPPPAGIGRGAQHPPRPPR